MNLKKSPITGNYSVIDNIFAIDSSTYSVCTESGYFNAVGLDLPDDDLFVVDDDGVTWAPVYLEDGRYILKLSKYTSKTNWVVLEAFEVIMEVPREDFQKAFQEYMRLIND